MEHHKLIKHNSSLGFSSFSLMVSPSSWEIYICSPAWNTIIAIGEKKPAVKDSLRQVAMDDLGKAAPEGGVDSCRPSYKDFPWVKQL